jgi:hypothetical protein
MSTLFEIATGSSRHTIDVRNITHISAVFDRWIVHIRRIPERAVIDGVTSPSIEGDTLRKLLDAMKCALVQYIGIAKSGLYVVLPYVESVHLTSGSLFVQFRDGNIHMSHSSLICNRTETNTRVYEELTAAW